MTKYKGLQESVKDKETVTASGENVAKLPEGVTLKKVVTHGDERGTVFEMFDTRWDWHKDPLVFSYCFTVRPGIVKGWGLHKKHEDRYCLISGEVMLVLYDARPNSSTFGLLSKIYLSEHNRQLVNIPAGIWHADHNIGKKDAIVVNFPTICYDHKDPDKYRLPIDTDQIPYKFEGARGG